MNRGLISLNFWDVMELPVSDILDGERESYGSSHKERMFLHARAPHPLWDSEEYGESGIPVVGYIQDYKYFLQEGDYKNNNRDVINHN